MVHCVSGTPGAGGPRLTGRGLGSSLFNGASALGAEELETVAERIPGVETVPSRERFVLPRRDAGLGQPRAQFAKVRHFERRMRLLRGPKLGLHADVQLGISEFEPHPAASGQVVRFGDLPPPEEIPEEPTRLRLAPDGGGDLNVMQLNRRGHRGTPIGVRRIILFPPSPPRRLGHNWAGAAVNGSIALDRLRRPPALT